MTPSTQSSQQRSESRHTDRQLATAIARTTELERQLVLARQAQEVRIGELERRIAWFELNELDIQRAVAGRPWAQAIVMAWANIVRTFRRARTALNARK